MAATGSSPPSPPADPDSSGEILSNLSLSLSRSAMITAPTSSESPDQPPKAAAVPVVKAEASAPPAANISDLNDAILLEILLRLDCRSAALCKSVSHRWCALISNPYFLRRFLHDRHLLLPPDSSLPFTLFLQFHQFSQVSTQFRLVPFEDPQPWVLKSFLGFQDSDFSTRLAWKSFPNGVSFLAAFGDLLLFCSSRGRTSSGAYFYHDFYMGNPLTRQWDSLRLLRSPSDLGDCLYGLVCEPARCDELIGCTSNLDYRYRVVLIHPPTNSMPTQFVVDVYASENREWTASLDVSGLQAMDRSIYAYKWRSGNYSATVVLNGMLHWVDQCSTSSTIVVFDPFLRNGQQCRLIEGPRGCWSPGYICKLGVCRNRLRVFQSQKHFSSWSIFTSLCVWELEQREDFGSGGWFLMYKISLGHMISRNSGILDEDEFLHMKLVAFHPYDNDVIFVLCGDRLLLWNSQTRIVDQVIPLNKIERRELQSVFVLVHPWWPSPTK